MVVTFFLRPFSALYGQILVFRNWLFDRQLKTVYRPEQRTISVGNLTVGGTGKTPMIEFLVGKLLSGSLNLSANHPETHSLATLSRGYGRQTKGFRFVTPADTAQTVGDEPLQIYRKFRSRILVAVAERRAVGLKQLLGQFSQIRAVLLDDAFQHRAVQPHLNILLTDYNRPFFRDHPFPEGRLREGRNGAKRADVIVVTKCPADLTLTQQQLCIDAIKPYKDTGTPIFFACIEYASPQPFGASTYNFTKQQPVVLVSGLANADPLEAYVAQTFSLNRHYRFNDHFAYSRATVDELLRERPAGAALLTTEKDWVKLEPLFTPDERATLPLYYLPMTIRFLNDERAFLDQIWATIHPN
ncbi:MAG: tetraacyldisaccharide 4'-kinase [Cytophagales bacterium]|nr:MAG: tetraacyldisaccharide 4'-kinase [Cytophagales bacterium]